jgi:hypothetical protein
MLRELCPVCDGTLHFPEYESDQSHKVLKWHECVHCDENGYTPAEENLKVYVNVYLITRHFGGYEEGGWYWNKAVCVETVPCKNKYSDEIQEDLKKEYEHANDGNIYSVLGGTEVAVYIERAMKESESLEAPQYE